VSEVQSITQQAPTLSRLFAGGIGVLRSHRSRNLLSTTGLTAGCVRMASCGLCVRQSLQQASNPLPLTFKRLLAPFQACIFNVRAFAFLTALFIARLFYASLY